VTLKPSRTQETGKEVWIHNETGEKVTEEPEEERDASFKGTFACNK